MEIKKVRLMHGRGRPVSPDRVEVSNSMEP